MSDKARRKTGSRAPEPLQVVTAVSAGAPPRCDYDKALHPDHIGHDVRLYGMDADLPEGATLTIGFAAGPGPDEGKAMVASGPRADVVRVLREAGYLVSGEEESEAAPEPTIDAAAAAAEVEDARRGASRETMRETVKRIEKLVHQLGIETRKLQAAADADEGGSAGDRTWRHAFVLMPLKLLILATRSMIDGTPSQRYETDADRGRHERLQQELLDVMNKCLTELEKRNREQEPEEDPLDRPLH